MRSIAVASATHPFQFQIDMLKKGAPLIETTYGPKSYLSYPCKIRLSNQNRVRCEQKVSSLDQFPHHCWQLFYLRIITHPYWTVTTKSSGFPWNVEEADISFRRGVELSHCSDAETRLELIPDIPSEPITCIYTAVLNITSHASIAYRKQPPPQRSVAVNSVTATMNSVTVIVDSLRLSW